MSTKTHWVSTLPASTDQKAKVSFVTADTGSAGRYTPATEEYRSKSEKAAVADHSLPMFA